MPRRWGVRASACEASAAEAVPAFTPNPSCMVAAVCAWHEHHTRATAAIGRRLRGRERMIVAAPALIEAYSVLTRLPAPFLFFLIDALAALLNAFPRGAPLVA